MMTYTIENPDTGRTFNFANQAAYDKAEEWYAAQSKTRLITYAQDWNLPIFTDQEETKLRSDWADIILEHKAAFFHVSKP